EKEKAPTVTIDGFEEEKPVEKIKEPEQISIKVDEPKKPHIVGKIDLDSLNKKPTPKATPKDEVPVKKEKVEKPVEKPVEKKPEPIVEAKVKEDVEVVAPQEPKVE